MSLSGVYSPRTWGWPVVLAEPPADRESGTKWGRLRGERYGVQCPAEAGVPAVEVAGEMVVEDAGAGLQQQMGAAGVRSPGFRRLREAGEEQKAHENGPSLSGRGVAGVAHARGPVTG